MSPPVEESAGTSPVNFDISVSFFLTRIKIIHFPTFPKLSGQNPRGKEIVGVLYTLYAVLTWLYRSAHQGFLRTKE